MAVTLVADEPRRFVYVPPTFGKEKAETAKDVLEAAALLLEEEDGKRWVRCAWYTPEASGGEPADDQPEPSENPYCGSWGACADGALRIVSMGLFLHDPPHKKTYIPGCDCDTCSQIADGTTTFEWSSDPDSKAEGYDAYIGARKAAEAYMVAHPDEYMGMDELILYNDVKATREDVVDLFRRAAANGNGD